MDTIKVSEKRNENQNDIDKVEILEETYNSTKEVDTDVELRIEGTECAEFAAELRMVQSRKESVKANLNRTKSAMEVKVKEQVLEHVLETGYFTKIMRVSPLVRYSLGNTARSCLGPVTTPTKYHTTFEN